MTHATTEATSTMSRTDTHRVWDLAAHLSPLILAANIAVVAGKAYGWIAFLLPLGPLLVSAAMRFTRQGTPRGLRSLLGFDIVSAVMIGGAWVLMASNDAWPLLTYIFPLALLTFTLGLANFAMVTVSRAVRAWKGTPFDYPWIIAPARRIVGLGDVWEE